MEKKHRKNTLELTAQERAEFEMLKTGFGNAMLEAGMEKETPETANALDKLLSYMFHITRETARTQREACEIIAYFRGEIEKEQNNVRFQLLTGKFFNSKEKIAITGQFTEPRANLYVNHNGFITFHKVIWTDFKMSEIERPCFHGIIYHPEVKVTGLPKIEDLESRADNGNYRWIADREIVYPGATVFANNVYIGREAVLSAVSTCFENSYASHIARKKIEDLSRKNHGIILNINISKENPEGDVRNN